MRHLSKLSLWSVLAAALCALLLVVALDRASTPSTPGLDVITAVGAAARDTAPTPAVPAPQLDASALLPAAGLALAPIGDFQAKGSSGSSSRRSSSSSSGSRGYRSSSSSGSGSRYRSSGGGYRSSRYYDDDGYYSRGGGGCYGCGMGGFGGFVGVIVLIVVLVVISKVASSIFS